MRTIRCKGEGYIDAIVLVLIVVLLLAFALSVFPLFTSKQNVTTFANELAREIEVIGIADLSNSEVAAVVARLRDATGLDPTISISPTGRIQLNDAFTVVVTVERSLFSLGNRSSTPITIQSIAVGRSERYWKP